MELVDAKCPNCGSVIQLNKSKKIGVCEHCKSNFLIDEAIQNYITNNYIEHATIIKNDFGDDVLYNEIDKYIAQLSLNNFDRLSEVVDNLKTKFPHKGLSRIAILHYQFITLISQNGTEYDFKKESEKVYEVYEKYKPKSYRHTPPFSKYLDNDIVEMGYAENIEGMLTQEQKQKYPKLIEKTLEYLGYYQIILDYNRKMLKKFEPYQAKFDKVEERKEKRLAKGKKRFDNKKLIFSITCIIIVLILALYMISAFSNKYLKSKNTVSSYDIDYLYYPTQSYASGTKTLDIKNTDVKIEILSSYKIQGRVLGKTSFLPFETENKIMTTCIGLAWGDLSPETKIVKWNCNLFSKKISTSWKSSIGSRQDVRNNFSSNFLIPANDDIKKALKCIKKSDYIVLQGYLVSVTIYNEDGSSITQTSSTSISDNESEIIYVTSVSWIETK